MRAEPTALAMVNRAIDDADDARILLDLIGDICGNISREGMNENDNRLLTQVDTLALRTTRILEGVAPQLEAILKAKATA